ncbi:MAG: DUF4340 domain-containing protein [Magnetococcales bacterium]|nr:DUF4340 domain-containing protein [Magnetococcales bacterium]
MEKNIRYLAIFLSAQVLLAIVLSSTKVDIAAVQSDTPLVKFEKDQLDRIVIERGENEKVVLKKENKRWIMPDHYNFVVDVGKIEGTLYKLKSLKKGIPVTTTAGALKRFKVSDDTYERRITFFVNNNEVTKLFLGSSPGIRQIHARASDDDAVYNVKFAAHDLPLNPNDWEDKSVLNIPENEIEKIIVSGLTLYKKEANKNKDDKIKTADKADTTPPIWHVDGLNDKEILQSGEVETLTGKIAHLRIDKVLGIKPHDKYGLKTPKLTIKLAQKEKGEIIYQIGEHDEGEFYIVKTSTRPEYFKVTKYLGEALVNGASRDKLIKTNKDETEDNSTKQ